MENKPLSLFSLSLRAFFKTLFVMAGIGLGLIPLLLCIGIATGEGSQALSSEASIKVLPGKEGKRQLFSPLSPTLLQLNIHGVIGTGDLTVEKVQALLQAAQEPPFQEGSIRGILLHVRSPGGTAIDSDGIYHLLKELKGKLDIPIYTYVDGISTSGGVYISCASDRIYATEASLIGSVGVILPTYLNYSKLLADYGIETKVLSKGKGKDSMNALRPWKEGEEGNFDELIQDSYQRFVSIVAANRPHIDEEQLTQNYGAKVFHGEKALQAGLIDAMSNSVQPVIAALAEAAGIGEEESYQLIELSPKFSFTDLLQSRSPFLTGKVNHQLVLPDLIQPELQGQLLYLYQPHSASYSGTL